MPLDLVLRVKLIGRRKEGVVFQSLQRLRTCLDDQRIDGHKAKYPRATGGGAVPDHLRDGKLRDDNECHRATSRRHLQFRELLRELPPPLLQRNRSIRQPHLPLHGRIRVHGDCRHTRRTRRLRLHGLALHTGRPHRICRRRRCGSPNFTHRICLHRTSNFPGALRQRRGNHNRLIP